MTDERLVERCRRGEQLAWDALHARYARLIRSVASDYFVPDGGLEDLEQEGRLGLFLAVNTWTPARGASFKSFAMLCVQRKVITAVKTATRQKHKAVNHATSLEAPVPGAEDATISEILAGPAEPLELLVERDELRALVEAIGRLSDQEREALVGIIFEGRSYSELSSTLRRPQKSIDNSLQRARHKLAPVVA